MNRSLSIYLDLLRLLASFAVVLSHSAVFVMPAMSKIFIIHGTEAVAIFFVLSGFVIGYVTTEKNESHWKTYAIARLSRMLSVVVIAIPMVLIVDKIGLSINPDFYEGKDWFNPNTGFFEFLRAISFTNEVWNMHSIFGSNEPYWSLGFEVLVGDKLKVPQKLEQAIRWLAGGSFTLYLLHMPLLVLIRAVWPKVAEHPLNGILGTLAVIAFCYLLAELGERRKQTARHAVEWLFGKAVHAPR